MRPNMTPKPRFKYRQGVLEQFCPACKCWRPKTELDTGPCLRCEHPIPEARMARSRRLPTQRHRDSEHRPSEVTIYKVDPLLAQAGFDAHQLMPAATPVAVQEPYGYRRRQSWPERQSGETNCDLTRPTKVTPL